VPGTRATDYLALRRLMPPTGDATVAALLRHDTLYHRLLEPLAIAALNTPATDTGLRAAARRGGARDADARWQGVHSGLTA
jgi:hypothetical protein